MRVPVLLASVALMLAGCREGAPPPPPPAPPGALFAPFPFTAEQIRAASPAGSTYVFRAVEGGEELRRRMVFREVDEAGALVRTIATNAAGEMIEDRENRSSWDDLVAHASYPAPLTRIEHVRVTVGAGTYAARLYEVGDGKGGVGMRVWFADELPGAPVKLQAHRDGALAFEMELVEHLPGGPSSVQTAPSTG